MTPSNPAGSGSIAAARPALLNTSALRPAVERHLLDRDAMRHGVLARQREISDIETEMVAACEAAAARGAAGGVRIHDRGTWDRAIWQRYLDAAAKLEPEYGPRLRWLYREIDRLNRLIALPMAA